MLKPRFTALLIMATSISFLGMANQTTFAQSTLSCKDKAYIQSATKNGQSLTQKLLFNRTCATISQVNGTDSMNNKRRQVTSRVVADNEVCSFDGNGLPLGNISKCITRGVQDYVSVCADRDKDTMRFKPTSRQVLVDGNWQSVGLNQVWS